MIKHIKFISLFLTTAAFLAPKAQASGLNSAPLVRGKVTQFNNLSSDGQLDLAVVLPSLKPSTVIQLDLGRLIGPFGTLSGGMFSKEVPGNLFLPKQRESMIIPITFQKEFFDVYGELSDENEYYALSMRLPLKETYQLVERKAPWFEIMKKIKLDRSNLSPIIQNKNQKGDLILGLQKAFAPSHTFNMKQSPKGPNTQDLLFTFQKTPLDRWVLTQMENLNSSVQQGRLMTSPNLTFSGAKSVFARIHTKPNDPEATPESFEAVIQSINDFSVQNIPEHPEALSGISVQSNTVYWAPRMEEGLTMLVQTTKTNFKSIFNLLGVGPSLNIFQSPTSEIFWARPSDGEIKLSNPLNHQTHYVSLINVKTTQTLDFPTREEDYEELFDQAENVCGSFIQ